VKDKFDDIYKQLNMSLKKCVDMAPLLGFLLSPFRSMVTLYTSEHLLMQYVFVMGGDQLTFPPTVFVGNHLLLNIF